MRAIRVLLGAVIATAGGAILSLPRPAHAEEPVTVFCGFEIDWCEALKAAYEKSTGLKAAVSRKTDGEALAQIRAEKGNPRVDVLQGYDSESVKQLTAEKLTLAYKSPMVPQLHDWAIRVADANAYHQTPVYTGVLGFGYNSDLLAKKGVPAPQCWKDLANPAYRNEIQMANPGTSSTAFNAIATILQIMGEDQGFKFLAEMNKNVNQYTRSGTAGITAAGKGETLIGIAFLHDSVAQAVQGYPVVSVAPCEGTGYEMAVSAILDGSPSPEAAKKWIDFALSPAGQNVAITVNKFQIPSNKSAQVHPKAPRPEGVKLIDFDLAMYGSKDGHARLLSRWEAEVHNAPK
jgi:iron(III) transport system substrate-binding protein